MAGMAPPVDQALLDLAVAVAREAGETTLRWFQSGDLAVDRKADGTPVTEADRAAERLVRERLAEHAPGDGVLGEEEPEAAGTTGRRWIVDPIDGTKGFTRGVPLYSTLLALEDEHGPALGVIVLPAMGEVVYAGRGLGCWTGAGPARVSSTATVGGAYLMSSSYSHWDDGALLAVKHAGAVLRTWGDGYGYALGRHRAGRRHGRPHRRALRRGGHAGDPGRGGRALHQRGGHRRRGTRERGRQQRPDPRRAAGPAGAGPVRSSGVSAGSGAAARRRPP